MNKKSIDLNGKTILITGVAGFIGAALTQRILKEYKQATVIGIDNINDYYDTSLKMARLYENERAMTEGTCKYVFEQGSIADSAFVRQMFDKYKPVIVVNLAAQAGVRYSIDHPDVYIESNIIGFYNILEACRHSESYGGVQHLVYASSSSVYGGNKKVPFSTEDRVDHPVSLYAATKKVMNCSHTAIQNYTIFHLQDFVSLLFTVLQGVRICFTFQQRTG